MAIGSVNLASQRTTESPFSAVDDSERARIYHEMQERKSYIYDAGQNVQTAEVFHRLADRAEPTEPVEIDRGDFISDQAGEYTDRLTRIETFVLGFRHVPEAQQWFDNVGIPILDMAKGKTS
ncbi:hypothetical protein CH299_18050 [Rhodococcus sp. 14-2686-1-2]|nr:hypothetical protein CH301_17365 [Rhodococcus sp. 15-1189-1-1a]OZF12762.1 hypothetical protein CH299_18050 [Rhodococcus sp. 14-2686-1-2]